MATTAMDAELGTYAPDFDLPGACGQRWSRDAAVGANGLVVMFICNHCPYVQAVLDRIIRDAGFEPRRRRHVLLEGRAVHTFAIPHHCTIGEYAELDRGGRGRRGLTRRAR